MSIHWPYLVENEDGEFNAPGHVDLQVMADAVNAYLRDARDRDAKAAQDRAVAAWAKALTDDDLLGIIDGIGEPFDVGMFESAVGKAAAEATGFKYASAPDNTRRRLEPLLATGRFDRVKGSDAYTRWTPIHARLSGRFMNGQWVYFTPAVAADFDERQRSGIAEEAERLVRCQTAQRSLGAAGVRITAFYGDNVLERRASVTLSLDDFETLVAEVAGARKAASRG